MLKRILTLSLAIFVLASLFLFSSCREEDCEVCADGNGDGLCDECGKEVSSTDVQKDGKIVYKIKVIDADGKPLPDMVVSIKDGEEPLAVKITDKDGVISCSDKNALTASEAPFAIEVVNPKNSSIYYDKALAILSDGAEEVTVTVYDTTDNLPYETLYPNGGMVESVSASILDDGGYRVTLNEGYNYFVFVPTMRGQYKISVDCAKDFTLGYYGGPHFVQASNLASSDGTGEVFMNDGDLFFNIRAFNVGDDYFSSSRYVFRIDVAEATEATVIVKCVDPNLPMSKEELPWEEYLLPENPEKYVPDFTVSGISALTDFDITDSTLKAVYNENDGFYHLGSADGPLLLVKLTVDSPYLASFETIMETTQLAVYVYGDDDILDKKINYHTMMQKYINASDENLGVYPLTPAIKEAIAVIGDAWGWYNGGANGIFSTITTPVVAENAYLFACCYYDAE